MAGCAASGLVAFGSARVSAAAPWARSCCCSNVFCMASAGVIKFSPLVLSPLVEVTGSLIENEPTLLVDLNILGKPRERKPPRAGLPSDVPKRLNCRSVLPSFVARFNSPQINLVEGFTASLCRPTLLQLIPGIVGRINQRIKGRGGSFERSRHQLAPPPARLLEPKAACLFRSCGGAATFRRLDQDLLDQLDVLRKFSFDHAMPADDFAVDLVCAHPFITRSPRIAVISSGEHNRPGLGAVKPEPLRSFGTGELAAVLSLCRTHQITHDCCERRERVGKLLVQLKI